MAKLPPGEFHRRMHVLLDHWRQGRVKAYQRPAKASGLIGDAKANLPDPVHRVDTPGPFKTYKLQEGCAHCGVYSPPDSETCPFCHKPRFRKETNMTPPKAMTVRELIEALKTQRPDREVWIGPEDLGESEEMCRPIVSWDSTWMTEPPEAIVLCGREW